MRIKSIVPAIVLALAASVGATSALAQDLFQYAGPSTTPRTGGQGYFVFHDECTAAFEESTWCTSQMVVEGGPADDAPNPAEAGEWLNPIIVGKEATRLVDMSGNTSDRSLNCDNWQSSLSGKGGLVWATKAAGVGIFVQDCNVSLRAACCVESD